jgi:hypothetical protein
MATPNGGSTSTFDDLHGNDTPSFGVDDASVVAARVAARFSSMSHMAAVDYLTALGDLPAVEVHAAYDEWVRVSTLPPQPADLRRQVAKRRHLPIAPPISQAWGWLEHRSSDHPALHAFSQILRGRFPDFDMFRTLYGRFSREWDEQILAASGLPGIPSETTETLPPSPEPVITDAILSEAKGNEDFALDLAEIVARARR